MTDARNGVRQAQKPQQEVSFLDKLSTAGSKLKRELMGDEKRNGSEPVSPAQTPSRPSASPRETRTPQNNGSNGGGSTPASSGSSSSLGPDTRRPSTAFALPAELPDDVDKLKFFLNKAAARIEDLTNEKNQHSAEVRRLMEELSKYSQQAADGQAKKAEVSDVNKKLRAEIAALEEENASKEDKIKALKDRVQFSAVDQAQSELKKQKQENTVLQEKLQEAEKKYQDLVTQMEEVQQDLVIMTKAREQLEQAQYDVARNAKLLVSKEAELSAVTAVLTTLKQTHEASISAHNQQLATLQQEASLKLDEVEAQRRNYKQKADSIAKDLQKLVKIDEKCQKENKRLQEELVRKTKCLTDAIEALSVYMKKEDDEYIKNRPVTEQIARMAGDVANTVVAKPMKMAGNMAMGMATSVAHGATVVAQAATRPMRSSKSGAPTPSVSTPSTPNKKPNTTKSAQRQAITPASDPTTTSD